MARQGGDGMAQSEARDRAPLHLHLSLFLSFSLFAAGGDGAARCRGDGKARQGKGEGLPKLGRTVRCSRRAGGVRAGPARQGRRYSPSIRSILKMTGLVPSEQQAIMVFSSRIQPRMMEPP